MGMTHHRDEELWNAAIDWLRDWNLRQIGSEQGKEGD